MGPSSHSSRIEAANKVLLEEGRVEAAEEYFLPDYRVHLTDRDVAGGWDVVRQFVDMLDEGFSDLEVEVEVLAESGDRIAWMRKVSGTQDGTFVGFPPSNRSVVWRDMLVSRFEDGRIAEEWAVSDLAEQLLRARKV